MQTARKLAAKVLERRQKDNERKENNKKCCTNSKCKQGQQRHLATVTQITNLHATRTHTNMHTYTADMHIHVCVRTISGCCIWVAFSVGVGLFTPIYQLTYRALQQRRLNASVDVGSGVAFVAVVPVKCSTPPPHTPPHAYCGWQR